MPGGVKAYQPLIRAVLCTGVGFGVDSLTVGLVAICRVKFSSETRDAVASLHRTAEEARITCAIVDAAANVRTRTRVSEGLPEAGLNCCSLPVASVKN